VALLPFFQWCEASAVGTAIRESVWLFAAIEAMHLLGLALIGGVVLLVNLRMFGYGMKEQPVAELAREAQPWMIGSLALMVPTGVLLFLSESTKCYYSTAFWIKMVCLALALIFTFTIHRRVAGDGETQAHQLRNRVVAAVSVMLWFGVAWGGRWIGFS
jgi:hypothetical protein